MRRELSEEENFGTSVAGSDGGTGWRVYRDIWIKCGGITQVDTMIVTSGGIYVCDAKNGAGEYVYADGKWYMGGRELNHDIFVQLKRSMEKVNAMRDLIGAILRPGVKFYL